MCVLACSRLFSFVLALSFCDNINLAPIPVVHTYTHTNTNTPHVTLLPPSAQRSRLHVMKMIKSFIKPYLDSGRVSGREEFKALAKDITRKVMHKERGQSDSGHVDVRTARKIEKYVDSVCSKLGEEDTEDTADGGGRR